MIYFKSIVAGILTMAIDWSNVSQNRVKRKRRLRIPSLWGTVWLRVFLHRGQGLCSRVMRSDMTNEQMRGSLERLTRTGRKVYRTLKGDWGRRKKRMLVGTVEDEVSVVLGDVRHAIERIRTPRGDVCYRTCYHTWESRIRANRSKLQVGYGQYPSILSPVEQSKLLTLARQKGWRDSPDLATALGLVSGSEAP